MQNGSTKGATGIYRSHNLLGNFKIRVSLKRADESDWVFKDNAENEFNQSETVEMQPLRVQGSDTSIEEYTFTWQEKVFSTKEMAWYGKESNCFSYLDKRYHEEIKRQRLTSSMSQHHVRLFSYTNDDIASGKCQHLQPPQLIDVESFLADMVDKDQGLKQLPGQGSSFLKNQLSDPVCTVKAGSIPHVTTAAKQTMYLMANFTAATSEEVEEVVLCRVSVDANRVILVTPDFNGGRRPYQVCSHCSDVFEYTVEHASKPLSILQAKQEMAVLEKLCAHHNEMLEGYIGNEFSMPSSNTVAVHVYGEIVSAKNFENNQLYIHYFVQLPQGWTAVDEDQLTGVTQTCSTTVDGQDELAYFCFPFYMELNFKPEVSRSSRGAFEPSVPQLFVEVLSVDYWERFRTEGYGYSHLPSQAGHHVLTLLTWKPVLCSIRDKLQRFFIGDPLGLEDVTDVAVPSTFQGKHMSKLGFQTETSGIIEVRLNIINQHCETTSSESMYGQRRIMDRTATIKNAVAEVLEAFCQARRRMLAARQLPTKQE